jgi:acid phosphatase type 7
MTRLCTRLVAGVAIALGCLGSVVTSAHGVPVIAAAGSIACDTTSNFYNGGLGSAGHCRQKATSDLLVGAGLSAVLTLGDNQYHVGSLGDFNAVFDPTWGRVKSIIHPAIGQREYSTADARGYFDYFNGLGRRSGPAGDRDKGYYSFDVGSWHLIALNSNCDRIDRGPAADGCAAGSPQERWLRSDLATHPASCTLAYWHRPLFNSGLRGDFPGARAFWEALSEAGADVILGGDPHHYERFAPQTPGGNPDPERGIREFIAGTGGAFFTSWSSLKPNSEVRYNRSFGVLTLALHPGRYEWRFLPEAGGTFTDAGSGACHGRTAGFGASSAPRIVKPTPAITALKLKPSKFRSAKSGASIARKRRRSPIGTIATYKLSVDATVAFKVERAKKGRKRGGKCRKPRGRAKGKRCTRYLSLRGGFEVGGRAGINRFRFTGRLRNRKLAARRYRLVATPRDAEKIGKSVVAGFRIRR